MNPSELTDDQLLEQIEVVKNRSEQDEILLQYSGVDRVVSSKQLKELIDSEPEPITVTSGYSKLDRTTEGFKAGELVVISGPTGQGKTTFMQSLTTKFCEKGIVPCWFSFEVPKRDFIKKFPDLPNFCLPLELVPSSVEWLKKRVLEAKVKFGATVVFIDHLHFLIGMEDLARAKNSSLAVGDIMRKLKLFALESDTTIFLVSHLSKTKLEDTPDIDDLRDSSFIGQESDIVLVVWRERDDKNDFTNISNIRVAKNRRVGTIGTIPFTFIKGIFEEAYVEQR